ncbi:S1C family serine protease [Ferrovibrio xuzhouensis]|uniref:Trypsin-like peptidase domain-containing protein n=1 Tax=Ferrovibrio xuzhouensis TaxID=1576914 RepID=A0ABV7VG24_9PROT
MRQYLAVWVMAAMAAMATMVASCGGPLGAPPEISARPVTRPDGTVVQPSGPGSLFAESDMRPIGFSRVQTTIPRGAVIGETHYRPLTCEVGTSLHYDNDRRLLNPTAYSDIFHTIFKEYGYRVVGEPNALFEERNAAKPDFLAGASITKVSGDLCQYVQTTNLSGTVRITVNWQIYDPVRRQVVWRRDIDGEFATNQRLIGDYTIFVQHAFADTVNRLAADPELRQLLSRRPELAAAPAAVVARHPLLRLPLSQLPIDRQGDAIRAATVLIEVGAGGHGSGFLVSESGLLVTNAHVVGGQHFVRVRLLSGRAVVGEVLQVDEQRDVALVKLEGGGYPALPVRETPVRVAEEVYAVGAPRMKELGWTVTRGVVSSYRQAMPPEQLDYIQADVSVHGGNSGGPLLDRTGNVVGICAAGIGMGETKTNAGLNLFIPILDGLGRLGFDLGPGPAAATAQSAGRQR